MKKSLCTLEITMSSHLFQQLFTPELTIPNTTSTMLLISIIVASLSALIIGFLSVIICTIICITIYRHKSKVKSSVTSIELNGRLSNHYDKKTIITQLPLYPINIMGLTLIHMLKSRSAHWYTMRLTHTVEIVQEHGIVHMYNPVDIMLIALIYLLM